MVMSQVRHFQMHTCMHNHAYMYDTAQYPAFVFRCNHVKYIPVLPSDSLCCRQFLLITIISTSIKTHALCKGVDQWTNTAVRCHHVQHTARLQLQVAESHTIAPWQDASPPPPLKASAWWMMRHFTATNQSKQSRMKSNKINTGHLWLQSAWKSIRSMFSTTKKHMWIASDVDCASTSLWMSCLERSAHGYYFLMILMVS